MLKQTINNLLLGCCILFASCEKDTAVKQEIDQDRIMADVKLAYEYPVQPTSPEWNTLTDRQRQEACSIPESILLGLKTRDLIEVILAYPLLNDLYKAPSVQFGLQGLFLNFNALSQIREHENVVTAITDIYKLRIHRLEALEENYSEEAKKQFIQEISSIELLASQMIVNRKNDTVSPLEERKNLMRALLSSYEAKLNRPKYFDRLALATNLYARRLVFDVYYFNWSYLDNSWLSLPDAEIQRIDQQSRAFLEE